MAGDISQNKRRKRIRQRQFAGRASVNHSSLGLCDHALRLQSEKSSRSRLPMGSHRSFANRVSTSMKYSELHGATAPNAAANWRNSLLILCLLYSSKTVRADRTELGHASSPASIRKSYALTAGHVLKQAGSARLLASPGPKGKLLPLPYAAAYCSATGASGLDLDVGILPLEDDSLGAFAHCAFLTGYEIDQKDEPDGGGILEFLLCLRVSSIAHSGESITCASSH
jgi:hypothetical protein